jgi:hypothetical protein
MNNKKMESVESVLGEQAYDKDVAHNKSIIFDASRFIGTFISTFGHNNELIGHITMDNYDVNTGMACRHDFDLSLDLMSFIKLICSLDGAKVISGSDTFLTLVKAGNVHCFYHNEPECMRPIVGENGQTLSDFIKNTLPQVWKRPSIPTLLTESPKDGVAVFKFPYNKVIAVKVGKGDDYSNKEAMACAIADYTFGSRASFEKAYNRTFKSHNDHRVLSEKTKAHLEGVVTEDGTESK